MPFSLTTLKFVWAALFGPYSVAMRIKANASDVNSNAFDVKMPTQSGFRWTQCTLTGPENSGFQVKFPMQVKGPKGGNCQFACEQKRWELNLIMSGFFRSDTYEKKCRCFLQGQKKASLKFVEATSQEQWFYRFPQAYGECSANECWARMQSIMNYKKDFAHRVSVHNQQNMPVTCRECETKEDCPVSVVLPHFLTDATIRKATQLPRGSTDVVKKTMSQADLEKEMERLGIELPSVPPKEVIVDKPKNVAIPVEAELLSEESEDGARKKLAGKMSGDSEREVDTPSMLDANMLAADTGKTHVSDSEMTFDNKSIILTREETNPMLDDHTTRDKESFGPVSDCTGNQIPSNCIIVPGPNGDEWRTQVMETGCKGNVLAISMRRNRGGARTFGISMGDRGELLVLQVHSTHNIADMARSVPSGLSISVDGRTFKKVIIQHRRLTLDLTLTGKPGGDSGFLVLLNDTVVQQRFPRTQKLVLAPTLGTDVMWEYSEPPSLTKVFSQGLLSVGAWFGAKALLPSSWVESIEYMPVRTGHLDLMSSALAVPCLHPSAAQAELEDRADMHDEDEYVDDEEDGWERDFLDDDEEGAPLVPVVSDDKKESVDSEMQSLGHTSVVENHADEEESAAWEYEPRYYGFNDDADIVGMPGHRDSFSAL